MKDTQMKQADLLKISEAELLDYASKEELFLFADKEDFLAIANAVLELVNIKLTTSQVSEPAEQVQWRNIQTVVGHIADFCFESKDHPQYGSCWLAIMHSLTAKDGITVTLEPLPTTTPQEAISPAIAELKNCCATRLSGDFVVQLSFKSCRSASVFKQNIDKLIEASKPTGLEPK